MILQPLPGKRVTAEVTRVNGDDIELRIINSPHFAIAKRITFKPGSDISVGNLFAGFTWIERVRGGKLALVALEPS